MNSRTSVSKKRKVSRVKSYRLHLACAGMIIFQILQLFFVYNTMYSPSSSSLLLSPNSQQQSASFLKYIPVIADLKTTISSSSHHPKRIQLLQDAISEIQENTHIVLNEMFSSTHSKNDEQLARLSKQMSILVDVGKSIINHQSTLDKNGVAMRDVTILLKSIELSPREIENRIRRIRHSYSKIRIMILGKTNWSPKATSRENAKYTMKLGDLTIRHVLEHVVRTPYVLLLEKRVEIVSTTTINVLATSIRDLERAGASILYPQIIDEKGREDDTHCYDFVSSSSSSLRIVKISTKSRSMRKKKCRVSTAGAILFRVSDVLNVGGFSVSYSNFDMTAFDLSFRLDQHQKTILRGTQDHITLAATTAESESDPFKFTNALIRSRGDLDHKSRTSISSSSSSSSNDKENIDYDSDTVRRGKDWNDFGTHFNIRAVVGTNDVELNLGCTLQTPRCAFHSETKQDEHHNHDDSVLPACCRSKLNEALRYATKLLNDNMIPHWIDYRTLIQATISAAPPKSTPRPSPFYQEKENNIVCTPNDRITTFTDADLGITHADFYKVLSMQSKIAEDGYLLKHTDTSVLRLFVSPENGIHIAIRGYSYYEDQVMYDTSASTFTDAEMIPVKHLTPIVLLSIDGVGDLPSPNNAKDLVQHRFGNPSSPNWEPPAAIREARFGRTPSDFYSYDYASWG